MKINKSVADRQATQKCCRNHKTNKMLRKFKAGAHNSQTRTHAHIYKQIDVHKLYACVTAWLEKRCY